jgi:DNA invertase Pin-like site-specific DNA recombinase
MSKHAAIYIRVSSKSQDYASQLADLKIWAANQQMSVVWYEDTATGTNMIRPGMERLHKDLIAGKISTVACWRLDRLGRTAKGLVSLFDELIKYKVNLVSLKDGLDLSTSAGRLLANVLASVASFETEVRHERQMAGIMAARMKGKTWGGSVKGRLLKITEEHVAIVHSMFDQGKKITQIAKTLNLSRPTIYKIINELIGKDGVGF